MTPPEIFIIDSCHLKLQNDIQFRHKICSKFWVRDLLPRTLNSYINKKIYIYVQLLTLCGSFVLVFCSLQLIWTFSFYYLQEKYKLVHHFYYWSNNKVVPPNNLYNLRHFFFLQEHIFYYINFNHNRVITFWFNVQSYIILKKLTVK
jgi:hypothetical protein